MSNIKELIKRTPIYKPLLNSYVFSRSVLNFFKIKLGNDANDMVDYYIDLANKGLKDEQIDGYVEKFTEYQNSFERLKNLVKEDVLKNINPDSYILEYGCGTGRYLKLFENKCNVLGIDTSQVVIDTITSKKIPSAKFYNFSFTEPDKLDRFINEYKGKLNVVFSIEVFQNLQRSKINILLNALHKLLTPNGIIILVFPLPKRWQDAYARIGFYRYKKHEMESLLRSNGFKIEKSFKFIYDDASESQYILGRR